MRIENKRLCFEHRGRPVKVAFFLDPREWAFNRRQRWPKGWPHPLVITASIGPLYFTKMPALTPEMARMNVVYARLQTFGLQGLFDFTRGVRGAPGVTARYGLGRTR